MTLPRFLIATILAGCAAAGAARADPCRAVPDHGRAPPWLSPGTTFEGPVTYVGDGDSLCVAMGATPETWVEVRLATFSAPELSEPQGAAAKQTLTRLVAGKRLVCVAGRQTYDRIAAQCRLGGRDVGDLMRNAGVAEGGRGRR